METATEFSDRETHARAGEAGQPMRGETAAAEALPRLLRSAAVDHLSHDVRSSLHVIRGHAELLRAEAAGIEARESASSVFVASVRLGGLCEDLIDFLRLPDVAPGEV